MALTPEEMAADAEWAQYVEDNNQFAKLAKPEPVLPPAPVAKMSDALADAYGAVLQGPPLTPLSSGFVDIDTEIPHFAPRQVTMLAADSGVGKSTVATQFALHGSAQKHGVIYFNLEMDPGMFGLRTTANFAKLPVRLNLDAEQHARFKAGLVTLARPASRIATVAKLIR